MMQKTKRRARWWSYVLRVIREYPEMENELSTLQSQRITTNYAAPSGGTSGHSDPVFLAATKTLPRQDMRELQAVRDAITATQTQKNGETVIKLVRLVYWKQKYTISGAADIVGYSYKHAHSLLLQFCYRVAYNMEVTDNIYMPGIGLVNKGGDRNGTA